MRGPSSSAISTFPFSLSVFSLAAEPAPRRASSPHDSKPIADAPLRRARAARLRAIFARRLASGRLRKFSAMRAASCTARSPDGNASAWPRQNKQINIGGPRADAMQRGQRGVRDVGIHIADRVRDRCGPGRRPLPISLDRFDFRRGKAKPLELVGARTAHRVMMKRLEGGEQPVADCRGGRGRELLPANDGAQPGKARFAPAQAESAGFFGDRRKARIGEDQLG